MTHLRTVDLDDKKNGIERQREWAKNEAKRQEELALVRDKAGVYMFVLPRKSSAKISPAAQSGVNWALNVNLVDETLLGNDYTVTATRGQLISIAVRLAEELTGKAVDEASSAYSDANDTYARKAATMGLTADFAPSKLDPSAKVTRQEMATVIYRTLRYVEQNSEYTYTDYDSKLDKYTDKSHLKAWAVEPMAFMNALDLVKPATKTTLAPDAPCAIETALGVAYDSTYAHTLGWYQSKPVEPVNGRVYMATLADMEVTCAEIRLSERVWVVGRRVGASYHLLPIIEPYSGAKTYIRAEYFHPVRWRGGDPEQIERAHKEAHTVKNTAPKQTKPTKTKRIITKKKTISRKTRF